MLSDPLGEGLVFGAKGEIRGGAGGVQRGVVAVRGCGAAILIPLSASLSACALPVAFLLVSLVCDFFQLHRNSVSGQASWSAS